MTLPREQPIRLIIVNFVKEIFKSVPGRESTEVSSQVAYSVRQPVEEASKIRETYFRLGKNLD